MTAEPSEIRAMFDRIAPRYDLLNTLLSGGADARWRRRAAGAAQARPGSLILDVATGSGNLARRMQQSGARVVGIDFSAQMLRLAAPETSWLAQADAERLPFRDAIFDAATIAFGLRNMPNGADVLREMHRTVKPAGRAVVLEFVRPPKGPLHAPVRLYLGEVVPRLGALVSRDQPAYEHLSHSIESYFSPAELALLMESAGWSRVNARTMNFGTVALVVGTR